MDFCPTCGMRLTPTKQKVGERNRILFSCPKCGFQKQTSGAVKTISKVIERDPQKTIALIGKEELKLRTLPTIRIECPKCGNNVAYAWQVQTRGSDESSTQFFRCTKCNFTFREYS